MLCCAVGGGFPGSPFGYGPGKYAACKALSSRLPAVGQLSEFEGFLMTMPSMLLKQWLC